MNTFCQPPTFISKVTAAIILSGIAFGTSHAEDNAKKEAAPSAKLIGNRQLVSATNELSVRFSEPMVAASAVGKPAADQPLVIEPKWDGEFIWRSEKSGVFVPNESPPLDSSYKFSVRGGIKTLAGRAFGPVDLGAVTAPAFGVSRFSPSYFNRYRVPREPELRVEFNDAVNAEKAQSHIYFRDSNGKRIAARVRVASTADLPKHGSPPRTWTQKFDAVIRDREQKESIESPEKSVNAPLPLWHVLMVRPTHALPVGDDWQLCVTPGVQDSSGKLKTKKQYTQSIGSIKALTVSRASQFGSYNVGSGISVSFNKAVAVPEKTEELLTWVTITPGPKELTATISGSTLTVKAPLAPGTTYQLEIAPGLPAADGTLLTRPYSKSITIKPQPPFVTLPAFQTSQLAGGRQKFEINHGNLESLRVRVKLLEGDNLIYALRGYETYSKHEGYWSGNTRLQYDVVPGRTIFDKLFQPKQSMNTAEQTSLDWKKILAGHPSGSAIFISAEGKPLPGCKGKIAGGQALVQLTDIGLAWKLGTKTAHIYTFSHQTGKPLEGASLSLLDREGNKLDAATTDVTGMAEIKRPKEAHFLLAERSHERHAVRFSAGRVSTFAMWNFPVKARYGLPPEVQRDAVIFTDRPVYRPGDKLHLKSIVRTRRGNLLEIPPPATAELRASDSRGRTFLTREIKFSDLGTADMTFDLPDEATGQYRVDIEFPNDANEASGNDAREETPTAHRFVHHFRVEDYKPNTFRIEMAKKEFGEKGNVSLPISASYLFGKALSKAKVTWMMTGVSHGFYPEGYREFVFGNHLKYDPWYWAHYYGWSNRYRHRQPIVNRHGQTELSPDGSVVLELDLSTKQEAPTPMQVNVTAEITDINQQTLSKSTSFTVDSSEYYLGLRRVNRIVRTGDPLPLEIVAVTSDGKPYEGEVPVAINVKNERWNTVRVATAGRGSSYKNTKEEQTVLEETITLGSGQALPEVITKHPGQYVVSVSSKDAKDRPVVTKMRIYVYEKGAYSWSYNDGLKIDLMPDKKAYKAGETARILVKTPVTGSALVTVERDRVRRAFTIDLAGEEPAFDLPIEENDGPNIFVSVFVVRGAADSPKKIKEPEYRIGYCQLTVASEPHRLAVNVSSERSDYRPGETVQVSAQIKDAAGSPMPGAEVALYVVDEGVLSLTGYETPDPHDVFYTERPLSVRSGTSLTNLLSESPDDLNFWNKGYVIGGGGLDELPPDVRKNFQATPFWAATLRTDESGRVTAEFPAPDNLTEFRVMAVALAGPEKFGSGEAKFKTNKPLMVEPALPRFANVGDKINTRAVIHNTSPHSGVVEVSLAIDTTAEFIEPGSELRDDELGYDARSVFTFSSSRKMARRLRLHTGETTAVEFPVVFTEAGTAKWTWDARFIEPDQPIDKGEAVRLRDVVESKLAVGYPTPMLRFVSHKRADEENGVDDLLNALREKAGPGTRGTVTLGFSDTRLLEANDALDHLLHYPYGCVEQTTSSTLPWISANTLKRMSQDFRRSDGEIRNAIEAGTKRLLSMQTLEGGLSYWPGNREPVFWGSAYGGMALALAQRMGVNLPKDRLDALWKWMANEVRKNRGSRNEADQRRLGMALFTLALAGHPESSYHETLFQKRDELKRADRDWLALAILESGGPREMVDKLISEEGGAEENSWLGTNFAKAVRLIALCRYEPKNPDIDQMVERLTAASQPRYGWGNTFSNAWGILALAEYADKVERSGASEIVLQRGDATDRFQFGADAHQHRITIPFKDGLTHDRFRLSVKGEGRVFANVEVKAQPKLAPQEPRESGYGITRDYKKIAPDGKLTPLGVPEVGDLVLVTLDINVEKPVNYVVVDDPLPAVFEAVNDAFKTQGAAEHRQVDKERKWQTWTSNHKELRDDRALFFCNRIYRKGSYQIKYLARVRAAGIATAPPAKIEEMYNPERFGLSASERISALPSKTSPKANPGLAKVD